MPTTQVAGAEASEVSSAEAAQMTKENNEKAGRILSGKLYEHLAEIDTCCADRMDRMVRQMADAEGISEEMKTRDQLAWVRCMNSIRQRTEEIILNELVYA